MQWISVKEIKESYCSHCLLLMKCFGVTLSWQVVEFRESNCNNTTKNAHLTQVIPVVEILTFGIILADFRIATAIKSCHNKINKIK